VIWSDDRSRERDVDARFLLANERTLLAWARTSLALMAGGGAIAQAATSFHGRRALGAIVVAVGIAAAVAGAMRYRRADRAMREGRMPASRPEPYVLAALLTAAGVALLIVVALSS